MAKRFIDAENLNYLMCSIYWGKDEEGNEVYRHTEVAFRADIEQIPTADVVEVVRCKDCQYANEYGTICHYGVGRDVKPDHFCGYGEKKEEDI